MFSKVKSSVVKFIYNLFHPSNMPVNSTMTVIPTVSEHITSYIQRLDTINNVIGTEALKDWRVEQVRWYKTQNVSKHEYA